MLKYKLKEKLNNMHLASKLILSMAIAIIFLLSLVMGFTYISTINIITAQQANSNKAILQLKKQNLENYMEQIEDFSLSLRNDEKFMQISSSNDLNYNDELYLSGMLRNMFYSRKDILFFKLYLPKANRYYYISKRYPNVSPITFIPSDEELKNFNLSTSPPNFLYMQPKTGSLNELMTFYRTIINIADQKPVAFVEIEIDNSFLRSLALNNIDMPSTLCLIDNKNQLYFSSDYDILSKENLSNLTQNLNDSENSGNFISEIKDSSYLVVYDKLNNSELSLVTLISKDLIDKSVKTTRNISLIIAILVFVIAVLIILWSINLITRPLHLLAKKMVTVGEGNLKTNIDIGGSAEIKNLSQQFNYMIKHINELIEKNYISQLNEKTSRLIALEAQINPHFLYNTLQAISTTAVLSGNKNISKMVEALASIMRYSIKGGDFVLVSSEVKYVSDYLLLQKSRFDDKLTYTMNVDSSAQNILLPKISIQVLVENSISHGMETTTDAIFINIDVTIKSDNLVIKVMDNGSGIQRERLDLIREQMCNMDHKWDGIGLKNLYSRLFILYEGKSTLTIDSILGQGTTVIMTIPINKEDI